MSCGCDCGSIMKRAAVIPPLSPLNIIESANIIAGWDAADISGSPVAFWPDASGNGFPLSTPVIGNQPTWGLNGPNAQPSVLYDGIDDYSENAAIDRPAPGTGSTFYWGVLRQVTWSANDNLWACGASSLILFQSGVTPDVFQYAGLAPTPSSAFTVNTYLRIEEYFSNSAADYLKIGGTIVGGNTTGNIDPGPAFVLGAGGAGFGWANIEVCEFWMFNALPTPFQLALLDAYVLNRYGAGLT